MRSLNAVVLGSIVAATIVAGAAPVSAQDGDAAYACRQDIHPQDPAFPGVHVAALEEAPNGDLLYIFYAGQEEQADDVATYMARLEVDAEDWIAPRVIFDEPGKPDGNAVLWVDDENDVVHLLFSIIEGPNADWTEASLRMQSSTDNGETWTDLHFIREEWGWLFGTLPFRMSNGEVIVPIYSEIDWSSGWYTSDDDLQTLEIHPSDVDTTWPRSLGGMIQPATIELEDGHLMALNRSRDGLIWRTDSFDYGRTWDAPSGVVPPGARNAEPTTMPNNNSRIALHKTTNGNLILVHNPNAFSGRSPLRISLSEDEGATWPYSVDVEAEQGEEFSYPYLLQTSDGLLHLGYTHRRESMRHIVFTEEFVRTGDNIPSNPDFDVKAEYRDGALNEVEQCAYAHNAGFLQTQPSPTPTPTDDTTEPTTSPSPSPSGTADPTATASPGVAPTGAGTTPPAEGETPATGGGSGLAVLGALAAVTALTGLRRRR